MITVVGSVNLDLVVRVARLPDAGETVIAADYAEHPGGKGANQAVAAARAGGRVKMVARIGRDEVGRRLRDGLARDGVDVREVRSVEAPTGRAWIEVDTSGTNRIVVVPGANGAWGADDLPDRLAGEGDVVLLQREVPNAVLTAAVTASAGAGARVIVNLAPSGGIDAEVLRKVAVLVLNEFEAADLLTADGGDATVALERVRSVPERAAAQLVERGPSEVVITLGAEGAVHAGASGTGLVAGVPATPVDTTGAGDAFVGALACRWHDGAKLAEAVRFGCAAGALATETRGAQPSLPTRAAIEARLRTGTDGGR
ncbi:MAG: ribokinase [Trueperaceae bacterium]